MMLEQGSRRANIALAALSIATFTFVTTEILPIGLLTVIAADLGRTRAQVGLLVTGYAVVVVLASLPLARLTQRVPRRLLLAVTLAVFSAGTLACALAPSYGVLLGARLVIALAQALFWSVVASTATALFAPEHRGRTVARMSIGAALAPVLGVPAGTWLGQQTNWRVTFLIMAGIGVVTCAVVLLFLPAVMPGGAAGAARSTSPDRRRFAVLIAVTILGVTGALIAQTYITPFLLDVTGFSAASLGPLLLVSGVAGVVGTVLVGRILDSRPWAALVGPLSLITAAFLGLYAFGHLKPLAVVMLAGTGLAFSSFAAAVQNRALQVAPGSTDIASAASSSAFNLGIATGSFVGGVLIADVGVRSVALVGAALTAAALAVLLAESRLIASSGLQRPGLPAREVIPKNGEYVESLVAYR